RVGDHSVLAAQTGVSGSSTIGARVIVGGQVGVGDHCTLEDDAIIGAQAGIPTGKTIRSGQTVWGTPARPLEKFKEQFPLFRAPAAAARPPAPVGGREVIRHRSSSPQPSRPNFRFPFAN